MTKDSSQSKNEHERRVLEDSSAIARSHGGEAKRNADKIMGNLDSSKERPDLRIITSDKRLLGIEHFRVDHFIDGGERPQSSAKRLSDDMEKSIHDTPNG